jgi:hypothetical protein
MKPVRATDLANAAPVDRRGKRTAETVEALARRDALLHEAAARFCAGMSPFQAGHVLHTKLLRYQTSAWQRDRAAEDECPPRLAGRLDALLFKILRTRDHVPGAMRIAQVLSREKP